MQNEFEFTEADLPRELTQPEVVAAKVREMFDGKTPVKITGWRRVGCREIRTRIDWAHEVKRLLDEDYPRAELVTLVSDNLNTHVLASLYFTFNAETAGRLRRRLRLVHPPKNGSWLNMAEIERSILSRQCHNQRFGSAAALDNAVHAWTLDRNQRHDGTNWRFTSPDARIKLKSLYPLPDIER